MIDRGLRSPCATAAARFGTNGQTTDDQERELRGAAERMSIGAQRYFGIGHQPAFLCLVFCCSCFCHRL
jgi:hypothetical protein